MHNSFPKTNSSKARSAVLWFHPEPHNPIPVSRSKQARDLQLYLRNKAASRYCDGEKATGMSRCQAPSRLCLSRGCGD